MAKTVVRQLKLWRWSTFMYRQVSTTSVTVPGLQAPLQKDPDLNDATKTFDDIPGTKGLLPTLIFLKDFLPVIGKYSREGLRFDEVQMERYRAYGDISRLDLVNGVKAVFVYNPDDIRKVFAHEGKQPRRILLESLGKYRRTLPEKYATAGILIENGEKWYQTRSKVQVPMLRPQIVETYIPNMTAVSNDFLRRMSKLRDENNEIPNYINELYKWALESIGLVAFNSRLGCLEDNLSPDSEAQTIIEAVSDTLESINEMEFGLQLWRLFKTKGYKQMCRSQDYLHRTAEKYCNLTLKRIKNSQDEDEDGGILGVLVQKKDLDRRDLFTFMLDLLQAGIDTTSHSTAFALYLLARNPDVQEKAFQEIKQLLPSTDSPITAKTLNNIPYLKACVRESMRLLAVVEGTSRILDHDIALSGYRIPAGALVILAPQTTAQLEEYFEEPDKFKPERWLQDTKPNPYANLPFSHGPRMCIGKRVALQEINLVLIKILQNFRVEYHYEDIGRITRFVAMPDKPLRFSFIDRK